MKNKKLLKNQPSTRRQVASVLIDRKIACAKMSGILEKSLDEIISDSPRERRPRKERHSRDRSRERKERNGTRGYRDRYVKPRQTLVQRLSKGKEYLKVSNLHPEITEEDLKQLFETVGETSFVYLVPDRHSQDSKTAYVGFTDTSLDERAVAEFNGKKAVGQIIQVEEIRPLSIGLAPTAEHFGRSSSSPSNVDKSRKPRPRSKSTKTVEDLDKELDSYMNGEA